MRLQIIKIKIYLGYILWHNVIELKLMYSFPPKLTPNSGHSETTILSKKKKSLNIKEYSWRIKHYKLDVGDMKTVEIKCSLKLNAFIIKWEGK